MVLQGGVAEMDQEILEKNLKMAEQGNPKAMCILGDTELKIYLSNREKDKCNAAKAWYEKAAEIKSEYQLYALNRILNIKIMFALAGVGVNSNKIDDFIKKEWQEAFELSKRCVVMANNGVQGVEHINKKALFKSYYRTRYMVALCDYELKNYQDCILMTENVNRTEYKILYWNSMLYANRINAVYACEQLETVLKDSTYGEVLKSFLEEKEYFNTANMLSYAYREGEKFGIKKDIDKSKNILNFVRGYLKYDTFKELADKQLACYKKETVMKTKQDNSVDINKLQNCHVCNNKFETSIYKAFDLQDGYKELEFCSKECLKEWIKKKRTGIVIALVIGFLVGGYVLFGGGSIVEVIFCFVLPFMIRQTRKGLLSFMDGGVFGEIVTLATLIFGTITVIYPAYKLFDELTYYKKLSKQYMI